VPHRIIWSWYTARWWVGCYIWYSDEGLSRLRPRPVTLLAVPNVTAHPSTASVPITVLLYNGPFLCGFVPVKWLINTATTLLLPVAAQRLMSSHVRFHHHHQQHGRLLKFRRETMYNRQTKDNKKRCDLANLTNRVTFGRLAVIDFELGMDVIV